MTVTYTLSMPEPETHLFHVEMDVPMAGADTLRLAMPAWAPGSYVIRDFARHVQDFEATTTGGKPLEWTREDKQTWAIAVDGARGVRIRYKVWAHELSVQTNHLDVTHGYANGTSTFLYVEGRKQERVRLKVKVPRGWHVDVALPEASRNTFEANDYDHLADSPLECGTHRRLEFRVLEKRHRVALYGRGNEDADRITGDLARIVSEEAALFGGLPYEEYLFIIHLSDKPGGGLEHRGSNTSTVERFTFQPDRKYEDFLALEAHEYFHTWNVKRLRPALLGPFDYSRETHTTLLWAMEGVTSYYDHLVLARSGLMTEARYREFLAETITKLRAQPGRFVLSLSQSSFLTWVKLYKQDSNWVNTGVSYYLKGELVALVLDLAIRDRTDGKRSLDDVMRRLYEKYPPTSDGVPELHAHGVDGWRETLEEVTGSSWRAFWKKYIDGTEEVDFERFLLRVGLKLKPSRAKDDVEKKQEKGDYITSGGWAGIETKEVEGRQRVKHVIVDSPAMEAGISPDDELVAIDGHQVSDKEFLAKRLRERSPGDVVSVHLFRRRELVEASVKLARAPPEKWVIEEVPKAGARATRLRRAWLAPLAPHKPTKRVATGKKTKTASGTRSRIVERGE